jgi:hypothetical protein
MSEEPDDLTEPIVQNPIVEPVINLAPKRSIIGICAISYRGGAYMYEWIRYHLCLGVDQVYIYNYDDTPPYPNSNSITVIPCKAVGKEFDVYPHCIQTFGDRHVWMAFMDINEFLVLKVHPSIRPFLHDYRGCNAIALNRITFGTNGQTDHQEEPVTKRFIRSAAMPDPYVRTIIQTAYFSSVANKHHINLTRGHTYNTKYQALDSGIQRNALTDVACVHHYYTKSENEFRPLVEDGWEIPSFPLDQIHSQFNEVYNTDAWDFYSSHL